MTEKRPPTLQDIADKAGVGRATVSLSLRNHPSIPGTTRERIQSVARELGYRPNPMVAALMTHVRARKPVKDTTTLAFVTSFPTRDGWRRNQHVFVDNFAGAQERATQLGYRLEEFWAKEPGMTSRRLSDILYARNIRGLLIAPMPATRGHLSLEWPRFAAATLGASLYRPDLPRATSDLYEGFVMALRRLTKLGYRRIGLATPRTTDERTNHVYTAAIYHYQHGIPTADRVPPLLRDGLTERPFRKWFDRHRPEVLIGMPGLMNWTLKWGLQVPKDVGYFDPLRPAGVAWSGIDQHFREIGAAAVDLVIGQLQRNELGVPAHPKVVTIRGTWAEGNTVRRQVSARAN
jgi:LacI family transcriptional regulator